MPRYSVLLLPDFEAGGYTVEVPSLPGVVTEGDTREEALENAREAISLFLEDMIADGEAIPVERARPELDEVDVSIASDADEAHSISLVSGVAPT
jgi:predicted RNase H-like HicB family nuclease